MLISVGLIKDPIIGVPTIGLPAVISLRPFVIDNLPQLLQKQSTVLCVRNVCESGWVQCHSGLAKHATYYHPRKNLLILSIHVATMSKSKTFRCSNNERRVSTTEVFVTYKTVQGTLYRTNHWLSHMTSHDHFL